MDFEPVQVARNPTEVSSRLHWASMGCLVVFWVTGQSARDFGMVWVGQWFMILECDALCRETGKLLGLA